MKRLALLLLLCACGCAYQNPQIEDYAVVEFDGHRYVDVRDDHRQVLHHPDCQIQDEHDFTIKALAEYVGENQRLEEKLARYGAMNFLETIGGK